MRAIEATRAFLPAATLLLGTLWAAPTLVATPGDGDPKAPGGLVETRASVPGTTAALAPSTLAEMLSAARQWVVAIEVVREDGDDADIGSSRRNRRRRGEARAYFQRPEGMVTGILIDGEGRVLTTRYNVAGKIKSLHVHLEDGRRLAAKLVAASQPDDLALLRIDSGADDAALPDSRLRWATRSALRAGQMVFAVGRSPDPKRVTVTRGIVSAVARNGSRAFQTDAELNYGNVGGPLIDLHGQVVGVSSHVGHHEPQWGINSGVGFGTTARTIAAILPDLKAGKDVEWGEYPLLGVTWNSGALEDRGAEVGEVREGSAADKAGMKVRDRILEIDGEPVISFPHLRRMIFLKKPRQEIRIKVLRGEETRELKAVLGVLERRNR